MKKEGKEDQKSVLQSFILQAKEDRPVYISDIRTAFQAEGTAPFHIQVKLHDGNVKAFPLNLPVWETGEEKEFVRNYIHAMIYNILSALGAVEIRIFCDIKNRGFLSLAEELQEVFQTRRNRAERSGYGKALNVNERVWEVLSGREQRLCFKISDIQEEPACVRTEKKGSDRFDFQKLPDAAAGKILLGIDIGGTDIKLIASVYGKICACKEYDWFPASFSTADQLIRPLRILTRLLCAVSNLYREGREDMIDEAALEKDTSDADMLEAALRMEKACTGSFRPFDGIGISFPDVVIQNKIVGGETHKTKGIRENRNLDYEEEFRKLTGLENALLPFVVPGRVKIINDGPMAAFTAAVERAAEGQDVSRGFFAHTLGTELGTGWVLADGSIPDIPLEVYNFIVDLGSWEQKKWEGEDARSLNNLNTGLAGTLQKYAGQAGVFRLAAKYLPGEDPELFRELFERDLFRWEGERLLVPLSPKDQRKACLQFLMEKAAGNPHSTAARIFREIGMALEVTWEETDYLLQPETKERTLFGRLVKNPACFAYMEEGGRSRNPDLVQRAADGSMAISPIMRQLKENGRFTVAQFAQAVGAIYYAALGLSDE